MLRLAGTPQGIHSASLLIKPSRPWSNPSSMTPGDSSKLAGTQDCSHTGPCSVTSSSVSSSASAPGVGMHERITSSKQGPTAPPHETASSIDNSYSLRPVGVSSSGTGCQQGTGHPADHQTESQQPVLPIRSRPGSVPRSHPVVKAAGTKRPASPRPASRQLRAKRRSQQGKPGRHTSGHPGAYFPAQAGHTSSALRAGQQMGIESSTGPAAAPTKAMGLAAQLQWEVGWNWKVGGPVASVTKQLEPAASSSGPSTLVVQQLKAAYDAKARSYTVTAGGAGWNVVLAVPTQQAGISGLVPRVWCSGCKPKLTLNLVPELACF